MRTGIVDQPLHVLDQCRTTAALVESANGNLAHVLARPLVWNGATLGLGAWARREVRWRDDGLSLVGDVGPGDWVSLHWDFVCERLAPAAARRLERVTRRVLASVNATQSTAMALE
jgi:hypothetical protein